MDEIINQTPPIIEPIPAVVPKKKLPIWVWTIPILFIILFIILFYIIFQQQQLLTTSKQKISENIIPTTEPTQIPTNQPTPEVTTSKQSDWLIYHDSQIGLQFQYPKTWKLEETKDSKNIITDIMLISPKTQKEINDLPKDFSGAGPGADVNIKFEQNINDFLKEENNVSNESLKSLDEYFTVCKGQPCNYEKIGTTQIGGINATEVIVGGMGSAYGVMLTKNLSLYILYFGIVSEKNTLSETEKQILSSVKID